MTPEDQIRRVCFRMLDWPLIVSQQTVQQAACEIMMALDEMKELK